MINRADMFFRFLRRVVKRLFLSSNCLIGSDRCRHLVEDIFAAHDVFYSACSSQVKQQEFFIKDISSGITFLVGIEINIARLLE